MFERQIFYQISVLNSAAAGKKVRDVEGRGNKED